MDVPLWAWLLTIAVLLSVLAVDLFVSGRGEHDVSMREAAISACGYVLLAVLFGLGLLALEGPRYAGEFFAGWLTEYSLSVDNLFVFVVIMAAFKVPRANQRNVLVVGIILALILRGVFIALGAQVIARFEWTFYAFGAFLIFTAFRLAFHKSHSGFKENFALRLTRRVLPTTDEYHGTQVVTRVGGRLRVTPMLIVMVAIGSTDLLFAVDSIPAIFGLTKEPYLVFTANAFALLGLLRLYFLIGGLLDRLVYLSLGLSVILGFIGVKMVLEALHSSGVSWAVIIPVWVSLAVVIAVLAATTVASLLKVRRDAQRSAPAGPG
ncbi:MAG: TerC/Alx family metal homeostasis membrane protein [Actinomycetota bacterium]|nr:TerC/Alx family metal homeostasis membrane protein [Actinomycetota bacterium]